MSRCTSVFGLALGLVVCAVIGVAPGFSPALAALRGGARAEAQPAGSALGKDVKVVVTVLGHGENLPRALTPEDVFVYQNGERRPVIDWKPIEANETGLDLAILVDDSLDSSVGNQWGDLKNFMRQLPPTTRVEVAYGMHGDATVVQSFTTGHDLAAKAIRLPLGRFNGAASIYMSLTDLLKHWPAGENRRAVLVISDGLDLYRGVADSQAPLNPDLQQAIDEAQRTSTAIYTLFANGAGLYRRNVYLLGNGQDSLAMLASATGGDSYFQGFETPLAFAPYLEKLSTQLGQQYVLTFRAQADNAPRFDRLRVTTEQPGVKVVAPERVFVPGPAS